jgi:glycogenin glucosyltransferase
LPLTHYDSLFNLDAPAGIINEKKAYCMSYVDGQYIIPDSVYTDGTWVWHEVYSDIPHGTKIPKHITDRIKNDKENMGINASLMLFNPSMQLYTSVMDDLANPDVQKEISQYNWPEMQYITDKLSGKWTNMDLRYSSFNGYPIIDALFGIHYAGLKPWSIKNKSIKSYGKFEDYQLWFMVYSKMIDEYPSLYKGKLKRIYDYIQSLLKNDKYQFKRTYIKQLKHLFK